MSCSHPLILCSGVMNKVTYWGDWRMWATHSYNVLLILTWALSGQPSVCLDLLSSVCITHSPVSWQLCVLSLGMHVSLSVQNEYLQNSFFFTVPCHGRGSMPCLTRLGNDDRSLLICRVLKAQVRNGNWYIYGQFKGRLVWTSAHVDGSSKKDPLACWLNWLFVQQTLTVPHPYVLVFTFWIVPRLGHGLTLHRCQSCPSAKLLHSLFLISFFSPTSPYL